MGDGTVLAREQFETNGSRELVAEASSLGLPPGWEPDSLDFGPLVERGIRVRFGANHSGVRLYVLTGIDHDAEGDVLRWRFRAINSLIRYQRLVIEND